MKRALYILRPSLLLLAAVMAVATACSKSEDDSAERWRAANDAAFAAIKSDTAYTELKSPGNEGSIYYKVLKKGTGTAPIHYTSAVSVYTVGRFVADYPGNEDIRKNTRFQSWTTEDGVPLSAIVSQFGVISKGYSTYFSTKGVRVALQYMHEGDRWEVWVPYTLGFGGSDVTIYRNFLSGASTTPIPAWSTLVFEIEVVRVAS